MSWTPPLIEDWDWDKHAQCPSSLDTSVGGWIGRPIADGRTEHSSESLDRGFPPSIVTPGDNRSLAKGSSGTKSLMSRASPNGCLTEIGVSDSSLLRFRQKGLSIERVTNLADYAVANGSAI